MIQDKTTEQAAQEIDDQDAAEVEALIATLSPDNPAVRAIRFIERLRGWHGSIAGKPIRLLPFQKRFIVDLLGTLDANGRRVYRETLLMIPKGNAKTSLVALLACYFFFCSKDEHGKARQTSIAISALTYEQASALFDGVWETIKQDPYLMSCTQKRRMKLCHRKTGSVLKVFSQDKDAAHSASPEVCLFDEIAAWKSDGLYNALTAACFNKAWKEPLVINITHAQPDLSREHFAYKMFQKAIDAKANPETAPKFLPVIYHLDEDEDWKDEKNWKAVSPGLGPILSFDNMRAELDNALQSPSKENVFRTYYLNQFVNTAGKGFPVPYFYAAPERFLPSFEGRQCFAALDLSSKMDLSCLALCFPSKDKDGRPVFDFQHHYFLPEARANRRGDDGGKYADWAADKYLELHPGEVVSQQQLIARIGEILRPFKKEFLAYDPWNCAYIAELLGRVIRCQEFPQTAKNFNLPIKEFEAATIEGRIAYGKHPITEWCALNLRYKYDFVGNVTTTKKHSLGRIDGMQAAFMAFALASHYTR